MGRLTPGRRIPVAKPCFDETEERLVCEVLRSGWVAQGPRVAQLEREFAARVGAADAVAVTSCTAGLFLVLHALGLGAGDEVIVPSLSFIASANAIVHCGAVPVFVDVDPRTYNLDPDAVARAVGPRTRAIMLVHQLGLPADLDAIAAIAERHGLRLVEDAACAAGSLYKGRPIGSFGHLAVFSFHSRKVIVSGEGGIIITADPALAGRLRRLRHQGMSVSDLDRHLADHIVVEDYPEIGYNFRMTDVVAAVALGQLRKLDRFVATRRAIAARYAALLADVPGIEPPWAPPWATPSFQSYIVRVKHADGATRNRLLDALHHRGVSARRGLMASHLEPCYRGARIAGALPHTEAATAQTMVLPIYQELSEDDQRYVAAQLRAVLDEVMGRRA
jgi:perosamine synthetase